MKLHQHFTLPYMSNTYLVAAESGGPAVLVAPGALDVNLLRLIEENKYYIRSILVTRADKPQTDGIRTILKIYDADIYSAGRQINDVPCKTVSDGDSFVLHGLPVEVVGAQGFSRDSVLYRIDNQLFTGDILTAGSIGNVQKTFGLALLVAKLKERF